MTATSGGLHLQECKDLPNTCIPWGTIQPKGCQRVDNPFFFIPTKAMRKVNLSGCVLRSVPLLALHVQWYVNSLCLQSPAAHTKIFQALSNPSSTSCLLIKDDVSKLASIQESQILSTEYPAAGCRAHHYQLG